jgi:hypothetical protein
MRRFTVLCAGYLVTMTGTALSAFALGIWIYQKTGSVTQLALTLVLAYLPGIVLSPVAGAFVDRWSRRGVLLTSDALGLITTFALAALFTLDSLQPWHIYLAITVRSAIRALQVPAFNSIVVLLVPEKIVGRANGMVLFAQALSQTVAPVLGGVLLLAIRLNGVILLDCSTFLVNVIVLLLVKIPRPPMSDAGSVDKGKLLGEARQGLRYLTGHRGLVSLVLFYAALDFSVGFVDVLIMPMVIGFASAAALGLVLSVGGVGLVLGSLSLTAWGGPRRPVYGVVGFSIPLGMFLCLGALRPSVTPVAIAAFGFMFCSMIIDGTTRSVLQLEVEPDMQGRVFALFNMVTNTVLCTSYVLAGPVADHVFEPLLATNGSLAGNIGALLGVGPGRGMALLLLLLGILVLMTAVFGSLAPGLRGLPKRPSDDADRTGIATVPADQAAPGEATPTRPALRSGI